jgi:hypothetical protein
MPPRSPFRFAVGPLFATVALAACASSAELVRKQAMEDFGCKNVVVRHEDRTLPGDDLARRLYIASGCGRVNGYAITGEWGFTWAVPCAGEPPYKGPFQEANPRLCAAVSLDGGTR